MGEKYPLATLLVVGFGGLLVGISGTAIAFGAYITGTRELAINENSYFQVLNNLRVGYAQIPSNSQRLAELQKPKEIVDIGYRQHLLNNLDADIRSTEEKLFEEVSAATREQLEAVLTKQDQARLLALAEELKQETARTEALRRAFENFEVCQDGSCADWIIR